MKIDAKRTVRDIIVELPQSASVFERLGIDHHKYANSSLWQACTCSGVAIGDLVNLLKQSEEPVPATERRQHKEPRRDITL